MADHTHVLAMAVNTVTGQTVKEQDLTGGVFLNTMKQRAWCMEAAERLASKVGSTNGGTWTPRVQAYTPGRTKIVSRSRF